MKYWEINSQRRLVAIVDFWGVSAGALGAEIPESCKTPSEDSPMWIDYDVTVGKKVSIGSYSRVERGAEIGDSSEISNMVRIGERTKIGGGVRIEEGVRISEGCEVKRDSSIGRNSTVGRCAKINSSVSIGCDTKVHEMSIISRFATIGRNCEIGARSSIGEGATVSNFVAVGRYSVIGESTKIAESLTFGDKAELCNGKFVQFLSANEYGAAVAIRWHDYRPVITCDAVSDVDVDTLKTLVKNKELDSSDIYAEMMPLIQAACDYVKIANNATL